jgi:hypothetical protein
VGEGAEPEALLEALPEVAEPILDAAPRREQFRITAWWRQTWLEIVEHLRRSVQALESQGEGYRFYQAERAFGMLGQPPLVVRAADGDSFSMRGLIDRVDRDANRCLRIIDYKTGGPSAFNDKALREGKKLQLPLYALAAQDALGLGAVLEGFYWHVRHGESSSLKLSGFRTEAGRGPQAAMALAINYAWEAVHGVRRGDFPPQPPAGGCPSYCPAVGFCWKYAPGGWG